MQITCYSGFSKELNSTKQPSSGSTVTVTLKEPTSVLNPVFIISGYNLSWNYIQWGNRYYYVDDIVIVHNNVAEYHCSSDPMATYKSDIGSSSQYIVRSASAYNLKVMDNKYPTIADTDESHIAITSTSFSQIDPLSDGTYVIGLKSKETVSGVAFYALTASQFSNFVDFLYTGSWLNATDITANLQKMLIDPFDYIISVNWYPFTITGTTQNIYFGFWDWTGQQMQAIPEASRIKSFSFSGSLPRHPQVARGSYLNAYPYTRIDVDLYAFGRFPIDPNRFLDDPSIVVSMAIDLYTGVGTVRITGTTGTIHEACATCSIPVQLSQVKNDFTRPLISSAMAGAAIAAGNYIGAAGSISDVVHSSMAQVSSVGAVGSITAYAYNPPQISCLFYRIADEDLSQLGRPLMDKRQISALSGYVQCENVDLETTASPSEKREIVGYMEGGFFYE